MVGKRAGIRMPTGAGAESVATPPAGRQLTWLARVLAALSAALGTVAGITPHVLHHIGPIAGTALLTGTEGSFLFGAVGFALTLPLLMKLKRRFDSWAAPAVALSLFVVMFTISALWIGPAIRGETGGDGTAPVDPHHAGMTTPGFTRGLIHASANVFLLSPKERAWA